MVLEALMGTGLAASAGLNAYIPLLMVGLLARFTDVITLPSGWDWIENPWMLGLIGVLLTIEFFADKIPVVDHINDFIQTVIRPTSGGIVFGASSGSHTAVITDPAQYYESKQWVPVVSGIVISLVVHLMKAGVRAGVNSVTLGFGAPVMSVAEDTVSVFMSLSAILAPFLVIFFLIMIVVLFFWARRRRKRRKAAKLAAARGY
ncbi:membrane protein [Virgisporangium aurantiacum]|uniref:Membrane protein n=1 Tax=Virgisporangium aurantiacum TaxID=175570 RepID=A0A8J3Z0W8_9ACTN|nr:membrane protein [Virgisporangium aurantiacum]